MDKILEKDIQKAVIQYLEIKKIFHWRNNSGAYKTDHGSFIRFGSPGSPDVFALKDGKIYGLEVKTATGKLSDLQQAWQSEFTTNGGHYHIIRSLDDAMKIL